MDDQNIMAPENSPKQRGVAAVEFALIVFLLLTLLFVIIELGRLFYLWNTVQEVTRRAAREAVVQWVDEKDNIINAAHFGGEGLPAGDEINDLTIAIDYLDKNQQLINAVDYPASPIENVDLCEADAFNCIKYVRATIAGAVYRPMFGLFEGAQFGPMTLPDLRIAVPSSTVIMPAESLGYEPPTS